MRSLSCVLFLSLISAAPTTAPTIESKCDTLRARWQERLDDAGLHALVAPPFVIAGDGPVARLARYRDGTILAAARALHATYFDAQPPEPILILLFESEKPYRELGKKWFGDNDLPHYGLYRHHDRVMLMNVSTGTGTLVHELTHALIAPDFPNVPDWFNEGLASLYEQSTIDGDTITGLPNWRLPALQAAIKDGSLRPLREMIEDDDFRAPRRIGMNYAQARYLMHHLQQRGQLRDFYQRFRAASKDGDDRTGLRTLEKLISPQSLDEFDKQWRASVLALRFE